ncbi:hypothetical protein [Emticicia sp. SJ17W-69]
MTNCITEVYKLNKFLYKDTAFGTTEKIPPKTSANEQLAFSL